MSERRSFQRKNITFALIIVLILILQDVQIQKTLNLEENSLMTHILDIGHVSQEKQNILEKLEKLLLKKIN